MDASVRYEREVDSANSLKEKVIRLAKGQPAKVREVVALDSVNLDVQRGEAVGIVGRNGAGKSTLLKLIARVILPTDGRVWVRGKVAPLLHLGTGFTDELTGRENAFLNGAALGYSREYMHNRIDRIIEFAEAEDYIDASLRTYSSGMLLRLAFAIATEVEPDILLIDEVLAVGDEAFQQKCLARMRRFREDGTTILFVSHQMDVVQKFCNSALWVDDGKIKASGEVEQVIQTYLDHVTDQT